MKIVKTKVILAAAEKVTPEMINFMATTPWLICAPLTESRCKELDYT
jgi:3,4-dihydroxy 2-butanone 4-phosphate synthase/GTP cyclohydrolase II